MLLTGRLASTSEPVTLRRGSPDDVCHPPVWQGLAIDGYFLHRACLGIDLSLHTVSLVTGEAGYPHLTGGGDGRGA